MRAETTSFAHVILAFRRVLCIVSKYKKYKKSLMASFLIFWSTFCLYEITMLMNKNIDFKDNYQLRCLCHFYSLRRLICALTKYWLSPGLPPEGSSGFHIRGHPQCILAMCLFQRSYCSLFQYTKTHILSR